MEKQNTFKRIIAACFSFVIALSLVFSNAATASAIEVDAGATPGSGGGHYIANGLAIDYSDVNKNCVGYRISVITSTGATKGSKKVDLMQNTKSYNNNRYGYPSVFVGQKNKMEWINNISGAITSQRINSATNYTTATFSAWGLTWTDPSGIEAYLKDESKVNTILDKMGFTNIDSLNAGDKLIVEPLWCIRLGTATDWHFLTVTEIGIFGRHEFGENVTGEASAKWLETVIHYTNRYFPNALYTPDGSGLWPSATEIPSSGTGKWITFGNMIKKGYGVAIAYNNTPNQIIFNYYSNNGSQTLFKTWIAKSTDSFPDNHWDYTTGTYKQTRTGYTGTGYYGTTPTGGILVGENESFASYAALCAKYGVSTQTASTTINIYAQWTPTNYTNSIGHYLIGFTQGEGTNGDKTAYHLGTTTFNAAYGSTFKLDASNAISVPNGCYLQDYIGTSSITGSWKNYNFGLSVTQAAKAMGFQYNYRPTAYTITYDVGNGTNSSSNPSTYNVLYGVTFANPTAPTGYTFSHWARTDTSASNTLAAGTNNYSYWTLNNTVKPGETYEITFGSATRTAGSASEFEICIYDHTAREILASQKVSFGSNKSAKLTCPASTSSSHSIWIIVYAGTFGSTSGNTVSFSGVKGHETITGINAGVTNSFSSATDLYNQLATRTTGNISVKAVYTPNTYYFKYNANGGTGTMANSTHIYDVPKALSANAFTRPGYTFKGWTVYQDGSGVLYADKQVVTNFTRANGGVVNLYAQWEPVPYTITYNLAGGALPSGKTNPTSYTVETATFTLNNPTRTGYTFTGWTGSNGATPQTTVTITKGSMGNRSYTANWTPNTNTVYKVNHYTEDLSGGTYTKYGSTETKYGTTGASITVANLKKTITGFTYSQGKVGSSVVTTTTILADGSRVIDLYYTRNSYTVTLYKGTGISSVTGAGTYKYGASVTINATASSGYTWSSWSGTHSTTTKQYTFTMPASNVADTANATANTYTITYNLDGGALPSGKTNPTSYTVNTATFTLNNPTKTGYTFTGWTGSNGTTPQTTVTITKGSTGNRSYTANWTANTNTVYKVNHYTEDLSGSTYSLYTTDYKTGTTGATVTLSNLKRTITGFTYSQGKVGSSVVTTTTILADGSRVIDLYYTRNSYTVTLYKGTGISSVTGAGTYKYGASVTINATASSGYTWSSWSGTHSTTTKQYTFTMPASNVSDTANATATTYTITYNLDGGALPSGKTNPTSYTVNTATFTLNNPTKTGYTFTGWTGSNGTTPQTTVTITKGSTGNRSYTANWTANTNTAYTVRHYTENLSGSTYSLYTTDYKTGTTGATVTLSNLKRTITGFTYSQGKVGSSVVTTTTILADGSRVIDLYYTRNSYTVTLYKGTGISSVTGAGTYKYGASVTINATASSGYTWSSWSGTHSTTTKQYTFTMPASNVADTANATATSYTITYNLDGGALPSGKTNPTSYTVNTATFTLNNPTKTGYTFTGWTGSNGTTPQTTVTITKGSTGNRSYTANWTANTNTAYTVRHYTENLSGSTYSLYTTDYKTGTTGATVTLSNLKRTITGFTYSQGKVGNSVVTTTTILADGSRVIDLYYTRNSYTVTITKGTGISAVSGAGTYKYGATVNINATLSSGYTWNGWTVNSGGITTPDTQSDSFTMPANAVSLTANAAASTDTAYKVNHYIEDLSGGTYTKHGSTETKYGTTGATITVANLKKTITGFTYKEGKVGGSAVTTTTVLADGSRVIDLYYTRNSYTVTLYKGTGISSVTGAGTYKYGASVTINATASSGYTWSSWSGTHSTTTKQYTFTMPASNVADTANATLNTYTITYNLDGGSVATGNPTSYTVNTATFTLNNPTKEGYTFTGWTGSNGTTPQTTVTITKGSTGNRSYTANWTESTNTAYKVNHYRENLNGTGYTKYGSTETKYGTTGASITVANLKKTITGFTYKEGKVGGNVVTTTTILADGSRVIDLYYTRNSYTVTITKGTGISAVSGAGTYKYGATVNIDATVSSGYTWNGWTVNSGGITTPDTQSDSFTMPAKAVSLTANAAASTDTAYKVNHYTEDLSGGTFTKYGSTETKYGTTGASITVANLKKTITGFTYKEGKVGGSVVTTTTILADGSRVIDLYYTRNSYTVTLYKGTGISSVTGAGTYKYGASVTINATASNGYTWSSWSGTHSTTTKQYSFTMPASNVADTANATLNTYTITYNLDGGALPSGKTNPTSYTVETETFTLVNPTKEGYIFTGWTGSNGETPETEVTVEKGTTGDLTFTANWKFNGTAYTVEHWQEKIGVDGTDYTNHYTKVETEVLAADADTKVTPAVKTYEGFTSPVPQEATVNGDGTTVVKYYYTRNSYTVTINKDTGIDTVSGTGTYDYGETVNIDATVSSGYTWNGWTVNSGGITTPDTQSDSFTMPANEVSLTANATLDIYTITYNLDGGALPSGKTNPTSYTVETETFTLVNPTKEGYTFTGWTGSNGETPETEVVVEKGTTGDLTFTANWTANTNTVYKVNHYTEDLSGGTYTKYGSTETKYGTTGATITVANLKKTITGFTYKEGKVEGSVVTTTTILADGSRVIDLYYTRNSYTVTIIKGTGISAVSGAGTYKYGAPVSIDATVSSGYAWNGWTVNSGGITTPDTQSDSFTMPANEVSLTANATLDIYTITYNLDGGALPSGKTNPTSYTVETETFTLVNPTKEGYIFTGWTGSNGETPETEVTVEKGTTGDLTFTANWRFANATYTVEHWQEKIGTDGTDYINHYTKVETENLAADADTKVTPAVKTYEGFTSPVPQEVTVNGDDTTVVKYYYTRNSYTVTINKGTGIATTTGAGTYDFGETVSIGATVADGYAWEGWTVNSGGITAPDTRTDSFTMPANAVVLTAEAQENSFIVSYRANGGTGTMEPQTAVKNQAFAIAENRFTYEGYRFVGWTTNADGTDDGYGWTGWNGTWTFQNGQRGISNNKLVLYARWVDAAFLNVVPILPNSNYREGVEVVSSFRVYNLSNELDVDIESPGTAIFTITAPGMTSIIDTKTFYVPRGEATTIYYRWLVPAEIQDYSEVKVSVEVMVDGISAGAAYMDVDSEIILPSKPPYTRYEDKAPSDFTPDAPAFFSFSEFFYNWFVGGFSD